MWASEGFKLNMIKRVYPQMLFDLANHSLKLFNCRTTSKHQYNNIKTKPLMPFIMIFIFFIINLNVNIPIWIPSKLDGKQLYSTIEKKLSPL